MDFLVSYCLDAVIVFGNKKVSTLQVPSKNINFEWLHNKCTFQLTSFIPEPHQEFRGQSSEQQEHILEEPGDT